MKKTVMARAWKIYRTLVGDRVAKLSQALKMAWEEAKNAVKKAAFSGSVKIAKTVNIYDESSFLTFRAWERYGKKRVYINDYHGRTIGFIENGEVIIKDNQGNYMSDIEYAINSFNSQYVF